MDENAGLVAAFSQLEQARQTALEGDFAACLEAYQRVEGQLGPVVSAVKDAAQRQQWGLFMRQLQEEQELVRAWEQECEALEASAAAEEAQAAERTPQGARAPAPGVVLSVDTCSFEVHEQASQRQHPAGARGCSSRAEQLHDPDVWPPVDQQHPAGDSSQLGTGGGCHSGAGALPQSRGQSRREREGAYEQQRRRGGHTPCSASRRALSGVRAKVNTGARRGGGGGGAGGPPDPKVAILDLMMDRLGTQDQELIQQLSRDVMEPGAPGVSWDDIAGLEGAKEVLKENVSMPLLMKGLFSDIPLLRPLKGVLLFGPPGTGKTMLAKAVATAGSTAECRTNFMNVSASTLASKYRGDSEKLVRLLFELARAFEPCVVFIDEIDSLCSSRGTHNEHEASRRLKTELLTQIDGMHSSGGSGGNAPRVMVLAATNYPWDIDEALRRRLEKRIYIPLPEHADRVQLLKLCLKGTPVEPDVDLEEIARQTEGFSGDDISNLCREAAQIVMRRMMAGRSFGSLTSSAVAAMEQELKHHLATVGISRQAFQQALRNSNPSCSAADVERHASFARTYGCT